MSVRQTRLLHATNHTHTQTHLQKQACTSQGSWQYKHSCGVASPSTLLPSFSNPSCSAAACWAAGAGRVMPAGRLRLAHVIWLAQAEAERLHPDVSGRCLLGCRGRQRDTCRTDVAEAHARLAITCFHQTPLASVTSKLYPILAVKRLG
eukprot:1161594-Pelagomonas_calceolata.AAC.3